MGLNTMILVLLILNFKLAFILLYKCKLYSRVCYFKKESNTTLMAESEEELKSLLMRVKKESKKASLKFNIKITKIMANEGGKVEAVTDFLFLGTKITADGDCSLEIRR